MLHLLIGRERKQNTQALIAQIAARVKACRAGQILIVPEQFSHDAERALCAACGDTASLYAEVLSFTRLADRAAAVCGGVARESLDAGGRFTAVTLSLEHALPRLKLYAAARTKPELIVQLASQIEEFKNYRVTPQELRTAAAMFSGAFAQKLEELALILESYDAVCAAGRADPSDKLEQLCERLWETDFAAGKSFYFDGFTDFTAQQTAIIAVLLRLGCEVTAAFVCDDVRSGSAVYDAARESAAWLLRAASEHGIAHKLTVLPRSGNIFLQDHLFAHDRAASEERTRIGFGSAASPAEECELAVREIRALLMAGYRCSEIAVACTNRDAYRALLRPLLARCGIPAYWSGRDDILRESALRGLLSALRAVTGGMEAEDVFSFLHSPIGVLGREECDQLQNYVFTWRIRGTLWQKEFTMHPGGYGKPMEEQDRAVLRSLNASRAALMQPLLTLKNGLEQAKNTAGQVMALYRFLEDVRMRERLDALVQQRSAADQRAQELSQIYDICIKAMEQLWLVLGETVRTPEDFAAMLRQLLQQYELGTIPARLDCVTVGDLASLRHRQMRAVLVLGAGDGELPQFAADCGILSDQERRLLENRTELTLAPDRTGQMDRELAVIYDVLCGAQDYLYISCSGD
ncbi:MAG: hypothetical protein IIY16_05720, partial [Oscillospiraceae bacterium]|nr:hypothetical protein [Oscillospiraceae bacterium]